MDMHTVLTHGLTYLAALALPLWLLGERLLASWTPRKPTIEEVERKAHREVEAVEDVGTAQKAA
jgi:hypothetical protein